MYDQTGKADWGYNPISNGGNQIHQWRTLTNPEWEYVFFSRYTASGIRYAKANVDGRNGVILLPDKWNSSIYSLNNVNVGTVSFDCNVISASVWRNVLEVSGAVFFPAAGERYWYSVMTNRGLYASSSSMTDSLFAEGLYFSNDFFYAGGEGSGGPRYWGRAVRLVKDY